VGCGPGPDTAQFASDAYSLLEHPCSAVEAEAVRQARGLCRVV